MTAPRADGSDELTLDLEEYLLREDGLTVMPVLDELVPVEDEAEDEAVLVIDGPPQVTPAEVAVEVAAEVAGAAPAPQSPAAMQPEPQTAPVQPEQENPAQQHEKHPRQREASLPAVEEAEQPPRKRSTPTPPAQLAPTGPLTKPEPTHAAKQPVLYHPLQLGPHTGPPWVQKAYSGYASKR